MGTLLVHCYELCNVKIFILYSTDRKIDVENWRGVGGMLLGNQGITYLQSISKGFHYIFLIKKVDSFARLQDETHLGGLLTF